MMMMMFVCVVIGNVVEIVFAACLFRGRAGGKEIVFAFLHSNMLACFPTRNSPLFAGLHATKYVTLKAGRPGRRNGDGLKNMAKHGNDGIVAVW